MTSRTCCGTTHFCQSCIEKDKEIDRIKKAAAAIRRLSGMFGQETNDKNHRLYLCCWLSRYIAGDAPEAFVREQCKEYGVEI
jgi:hypothetical protein